MSADDTLISLKELAELFGMQTQAARRITRAKDFPAVIVLPGGSLRWFRQEVFDWLKNQQRPRHTLDLGRATPKTPRPGMTRAQRAAQPRKPDPQEEAMYRRVMERRKERAEKERSKKEL